MYVDNLNLNRSWWTFFFTFTSVLSFQHVVWPKEMPIAYPRCMLMHELPSTSSRRSQTKLRKRRRRRRPNPSQKPTRKSRLSPPLRMTQRAPQLLLCPHPWRSRGEPTLSRASGRGWCTCNCSSKALCSTVAERSSARGSFWRPPTACSMCKSPGGSGHNACCESRGGVRTRFVGTRGFAELPVRRWKGIRSLAGYMKCCQWKVETAMLFQEYWERRQGGGEG